MPVISIKIQSAGNPTVYVVSRQKFVVRMPGANGLSAYQVAVNNGFVGTEAEWLDSLQASGGGGRIANIYTAGEVIGGQRVVMIKPDGLLYIYERDEEHADKIIGITNSSVSMGGTVLVVEAGIIEDIGWGLTPGRVYFIGDNGLITPTPPTDKISQRIGVSIDEGKLNVHLSEPLVLI